MPALAYQKRIVVSGATTLTGEPFLYVGIDARSGSYTLTLPGATEWDVQEIKLKCVAGTHTVTLATQGTDTLENAVTFNAPGQHATLINDGVSKWVIF